MTRTALPSLRTMVLGATRVTLAASPSMERRPSTSSFCRLAISPMLSVNISGVISTWTSRVSVDFTRSTMIW